MSRIKFMNLEIDNITAVDALRRVEELVGRGVPSYVLTPNVDHVVRCERDGEFAKIYHNADLILTDGKPLLWISRLYRMPIKEKISGSDFFPMVCALGNDKNYRLYLLGAAPGVADRAAAQLKMKFPRLSIVGTYSPPFGFESDKDEISRICELVRRAAPDILIVGLGSPKQEKFIFNHLNELGVPVSMGLGASIDFAAGELQRAPRIVSELGFEWLRRLIQEPRRLARRYLVDDIKILNLIVKYWPR